MADKASRTIAVVTGSRAEYGIYRSVLGEIVGDPALRLRLMVCGMHLEDAFGRTVDSIEADGFPVADRIETWVSADTPLGIATAMSRGVEGFAAAFARIRPDVLVLLGDRYDMLAAASAALPFAIPIAHIHGGELTEGLIDEAVRHAVTKMSHLHFAATKVYRDRIIQMGESPDRVFVSGAPGLDAIRLTEPASRERLEERIGMVLDPAPLLITFHPVTLEADRTGDHVTALMSALSKISRPLLFTYPNADTAANRIIAAIDEFVANHANARVIKSFGSADYFGLLARSAAMVGNSSSGLIEAPSFRLPVVNIGNRQGGRLRSRNVIDCAADAGPIEAAIGRATSAAFRDSLSDLKNPYGDGNAARRIIEVLRDTPLGDRLVQKRFYDLPSTMERSQ